MTHTFDSEVSLQSWLLWPTAHRQILWKLSWSKLKFLTWLLFKQSFTRHVIQSMSAEERRAAAGRGEARRGKDGSVARHTGTFDENSFHSTIHSAPKEGRGVKRSKNGWEIWTCAIDDALFLTLFVQNLNNYNEKQHGLRTHEW